MKINNRIINFPISFFAIILGMIGFTLTFQKAEHLYKIYNYHISDYILYFTILLFIIISIFYIIKILKYPNEVIKEWQHPIKINFYPLIAKILLVASIVFLSRNINISKFLWIIVAILQITFSIIIFSAWINHTKFEIKHLSPAWFLPIVGNVIIPIAGIRHFHSDISWFFFSIGILLWLVLFVIVIYRIFFHNPLPEKLIPTFFILFAPPAIAFISYVKLTSTIDSFAKILYYFSLFLFMVIILQIKLYTKIKFYLSWWAYSFPMAAISLATFLMYEKTHYYFFKILFGGLFSFLNIIIIFLIIITFKNIFKKTICIYED